MSDPGDMIYPPTSTQKNQSSSPSSPLLILHTQPPPFPTSSSSSSSVSDGISSSSSVTPYSISSSSSPIPSILSSSSSLTPSNPSVPSSSSPILPPILPSVSPGGTGMETAAGGGGGGGENIIPSSSSHTHTIVENGEANGTNTSSSSSLPAAISLGGSMGGGSMGGGMSVPSTETTQIVNEEIDTHIDQATLDRVNHFRSSCLEMLYQYQTHHLIPHSGKVVVFDSQLVVKHAFDGMLVHDLSCAPVWDSIKRKYVGLLSVSDFLDILMSSYAAEDKDMFVNLSNARICDWAEYKKARGTSINRLLTISPEATLFEAVRQLLNYRVHRLCVVQLALADTVLRIITNHGILRFLRNNHQAVLESVTVRDLGVGVYRNLVTLTYNTPVIKALELLSVYKVSSIPIVNEYNMPVDVYTRADVRYLALDHTWTNLDMTIEESLGKHKRGRVLPLCMRDDSIMTVSGLLVGSMKHSLIVVKQDGTIEGVISLTDIFSFLLNSGPPKAESRIAALKADLEEMQDMTLDQLQQLNVEDPHIPPNMMSPGVNHHLASSVSAYDLTKSDHIHPGGGVGAGAIRAHIHPPPSTTQIHHVSSSTAAINLGGHGIHSEPVSANDTHQQQQHIQLPIASIHMHQPHRTHHTSSSSSSSTTTTSSSTYPIPSRLNASPSLLPSDEADMADIDIDEDFLR